MSDSGFNEGSGSHAGDVSDTMSMDSAMSSASTSTLTGPGSSDPHTQIPGFGQMSPPDLDSGRGSSLSHSARSGQITHEPGGSYPHTQMPGFGQMSPPGLDSGRGSSLSHSARSGQIPHGHNVEEMSVDSGISSGTMNTRMDTSNLPTERVDTRSRTGQWIRESRFDVFVKNLDGKTYTLTVDANEDVKTFREKVAQKLGVPDAQQRLTTQAGKNLEDGQTLKACNVTKHSTIYCQGRLRGGSMTDP